MAETKYTYSITGDFPNQLVNVPLLKQEVGDSAIATALSYIDIEGDSCDVWFVDALSGGDQTILDGIVATHQGTATTDTVQRTNSGGESSTTSTTYQDKINTTPTPIKKGTYLVTWFCEVKLQTGGLGTGISVHLEVDGTERATAGYADDHIYYLPFCGVFAVAFDEAEQPILKLQYKCAGSGGDTVKIRRAQVSLSFQSA